jgi:hypothetical protein
MTQKFGPHFGDELIAAGLADGIAFNLEAGQIFGADDWPDNKKARLQALIDAHDPDNPPPVVTTRTATVEAMAELVVTEYEVTGVDTAVNIGAAFPLTPDYYVVYFLTPQPDAAYLAFVQSPGFNVDVTWREPDYFEIQVTDRLTGEPATPTSLSITVQRVR